MSVDDRKAAKDHKFGTFAGVFTPCTLTIFGVIMFLRFGQVVGQAGAISALMILVCAKAITTLTAFSLSANATNMRVKGGGAYYLISRSLGVEFGGAIGVFFFLAQAVSVALYVIGFTEAFLAAFPDSGWSARDVATAINIVTFLCVFMGAGWTIKVQYVILGILGLSLLSFFAGAIPDLSLENYKANARPAYLEGQSFFTMFALFFPAVTGIMAGANMSGDLRDPARSIPAGTLWAIAATGVIYALMLLALAGSRSQAELIADPFVVKSIGWSPMLINAGVFAATLSSALGSMMGAPRILQAFARDDIFRWLRFFGRGSGRSGEPRAATVVTFLIAQAAIMLGDLDVMAPVITMFFMITYGTLNLACFYEGITRNPSYRPKFRFSHWSMALLGAVACVVIMFLINPLWALIAVLGMGGLYSVISRVEVKARWGDVTSGVAYERARKALLKLEEEKYHPKNWRPAILALSGSAYNRFHLAEYAYWLGAGRGLVSLGQIITGEVANLLERREQAEKLLRKFIRDEKLAAFPVVVVEEDLTKGVKTLLQCHGIGGARPNTLMFGWSDDPARLPAFTESLRLAKQFGRSVLLVSGGRKDEERWVAPRGMINIWWGGAKRSGLKLLLAYLLKQNHEWRNHPLRILRPVPVKAARANAAREIRETLDLARIEAEVLVLETDKPLDALRGELGDSALLFADFEPPAPGEEWSTMETLRQIINLPGDVILVYNAGHVSLEA
ncbi:MAG TPA: amino acid permease [Verrucomicrobiae bacterium]|nr:amino acid permease [Verrucomicrobiae bacterium]